MGRRSHSRALGVWTNGIRVGRWLIPASGPMSFSYDPSWVSSEEARPLSLSLPMNLDGVPIQGEKVGFFFDNLLPDSDAIRQRIRHRFHTRSGDTFDLLEAIGRDCVGAIQLLPEGRVPEGVSEITVTPLDETGVEKELLGAISLPSMSQAEEEDFRISIAGAQEKTALTWQDGRWCKPHGATPTTHIFKLPLGLVGGKQMDMTLSLENEWLCARLLAGYGLSIASCEVKQFGTTRALVVQRFDRQLHSSGHYWLRLPQEDLCQATGTPSSLKYESDGGPGLTDIAQVLQGSQARNDDSSYPSSGAVTLLDVGSDRWPRQKLQHSSASRRALSPDTTIRRPFSVAYYGKSPKPSAPEKAVASHGFERHPQALSNRRNLRVATSTLRLSNAASATTWKPSLPT